MKNCLTLILGITLTACKTTAILPLCPSVAISSYSEPNEGEVINQKVYDIMDLRKIKLTPLSSFSAEFEGAKSDIRWLEKHYPILLCSFNVDAENNDSQIYSVCHNNAPSWISVVQSEQPEALFAEQYKFEAVCVR